MSDTPDHEPTCAPPVALKDWGNEFGAGPGLTEMQNPAHDAR